MGFSLNTHKRSPDGKNITKVSHYIRLSRGSNPPLYIQEGAVYGEGGGAPIKDLPEWFLEELDKVHDDRLLEVRYTRPERKEKKNVQKPAQGQVSETTTSPPSQIAISDTPNTVEAPRRARARNRRSRSETDGDNNTS